MTAVTLLSCDVLHFLKSVKYKKLQNTTFNPWTTKWLNPLETSPGQKQFFFPDLGEQGGGQGERERAKSGWFQIATLSKRVKGNRWPWRMQPQSPKEKGYFDRSCCFLFKHEHSGMES